MSERLVMLRRGCLFLPLAIAGSWAQAQELNPFPAPNLSPPIAIIGLPLWVDVPATATVGFSTELANHYRLSNRVGDQVIVDGETLRLRAHFEQPVGSRWSFGVNIPYLHQSGGILDDLIDGWHSVFGLPDGSRNLRPEGVLEFDLADAGGSFFTLDDSGGGLGDIQLSAAGRIGGDEGWILRGTVKLPTGRERLLAGSGETDWMLSGLRIVNGEVRGRPASYFLGGALIEFGQPRNVRFVAEDSALAAVLGGALTLGTRFGIKGQLDAHSAFYDSQLEEIGQTSVQATLGGWLRLNESALLEFAVSEDVHVSTTPDVVLFASLSFRLR